jgi:hypothetical protein
MKTGSAGGAKENNKTSKESYNGEHEEDAGHQGNVVSPLTSVTRGNPCPWTSKRDAIFGRPELSLELAGAPTNIAPHQDAYITITDKLQEASPPSPTPCSR